LGKLDPNLGEIIIPKLLFALDLWQQIISKLWLALKTNPYEKGSLLESL
jgi:hypothetical protein